MKPGFGAMALLGLRARRLRQRLQTGAPKVAAPAAARAAPSGSSTGSPTPPAQQPQTSTDIVQVGEPWNGLLEHRDGPPPGTTVLSSTVQNQRFTFNTAQTSTGFATRRSRGPDYRPVPRGARGGRRRPA